jgi:hypothetical protein
MRQEILASVSLAVLSAAVVVPPAASATDWPTLNGRFAAVSDGRWAKTRDVYHDEATVNSTWTITSECTTHSECTGHIVSDQGWSADANFSFGLWLVEHVVPDWERCDDGSSAPGKQQFLFHPVDATTLVGKDKTIGASGTCGISNWLTIEMPFTLTRIA